MATCNKIYYRPVYNHHKIEYSDSHAYRRWAAYFCYLRIGIARIFIGSPIKINNTMHELPLYSFVLAMACLHIPMDANVLFSQLECIRIAVIWWIKYIHLCGMAHVHSVAPSPNKNDGTEWYSYHLTGNLPQLSWMHFSLACASLAVRGTSIAFDRVFWTIQK